MSIKVNFPWFLQHATGGIKNAEVNGHTVGECIDAIVAAYPRIKEELYDKEGNFSPYIDILIDGRSVYKQGLSQPIAPGSQLSLLLIVDGG